MHALRGDPAQLDYQRLFEAAPNPYLVLEADPPRYTIRAVNDAYLAATGTQRGAIIGRGLFDAFPDNPADPAANGVSDLRASLDRVVRDCRPDVMGVQKYDIPVRDAEGEFEVRYWSPVNTPVIDQQGKAIQIIHRVEDVTQFILARERISSETSETIRVVQVQAERMEAEVLKGGAELKAANRQLKVTSEQLAEANARLKDADRVKTEFFANVSHEFRTPLTLMLGPLETLLDGRENEFPEAERALVETAHRNARRLLRLVNALLDFSRLEAGREMARFAPTDLARLTEDLASSFRSLCDKAGLDFAIDCVDLGRPVHVDRQMWEKIVLNLLSNAFKFTHVGRITVSLRSSADGQSAELRVTDTGVGIPADQLPRLFERFHRVEGTRGRSFEGSGIGLSLVRELTRLNGGEVTVSSTIGTGSQFTIAIPFGTSHLPAGQIAPNADEANEDPQDLTALLDWSPQHEGGHSPSETPVPSAKVLVVDDNADMRRYIGRLLEERGHAIVTAADGEAALAVLGREAGIDLVLADVMMPGPLDGFGLLGALRTNPMTATLPVILLSARAGEESRIEGLNAGADDYLVKPFGARELLARVDASIRTAALRAEIVRRDRELERARAQARLHLAMDAAGLGELLYDPVTGDLAHSPTLAELFGYPADKTLTIEDMRAPYHPEDRERILAWSASLLAGSDERFDIEFRIVWPDQTTHWIAARGQVSRDTDGRAVQISTVYMDTTERKRAEERRQLLVDELNHRVKNMLATVQALARQSQRGDGPTAFVERFEARLAALASAHDLLMQKSWEGASLAEVVRRTLEPYSGESWSRIHMAGPVVVLNPTAAVTLNAAFHELASNAATYGALSAKRGRVDVRWAIRAAANMPLVEIEWVEQGGPKVSAPASGGFGSRLVQRGLARELGGAVALDFDPKGVRCRMQLPVSHKIAPA